MIDEKAIIEDGVIIKNNVTIKGNTIIKSGTVIEDNCYIENSVIESNNKIGSSNHIGPYAHIRENNVIGNNNIIGSFVEVSNSNIGSNNKIKHLAYVGNVKMGDYVNIGANVVFANYHPKKKEKNTTVVNSNSCISSNCTIIAPVNIGFNTLVGAGSVVDKDLDDNSLYIFRDKEVYKKGYYEEK